MSNNTMNTNQYKTEEFNSTSYASKSNIPSAANFRSMNVEDRQYPVINDTINRKSYFESTTDKCEFENECDIQMKDEAVTMPGWNNPWITRMRCFYPLARTHCIFPKTQTNLILERLTQTFRLLSLHTEYFDTPSVRAHCRSLEQVEFAVNLWQSRDASDQIIVEVERISGNAITCCRYAERILEACHMDLAEDMMMNNSEVTTPARERMDTIMSNLPPIPTVGDSSLKIVTNMLLSERRDIRQLGLESLVLLTDTSCTETSLATLVAKALLLGCCGNYEENLIAKLMQDQVFHLILLGQWSESATPSGEQLHHDDSRPHVFLALMAMANSIELMTSPSQLSLILSAASKIAGEDSLMFSLKNFVQNTHENPHAAYLATKIFAAFHTMGMFSVHDETVDAVRAAQKIGHCSHVALERATKKLLSTLEV